MPNRHCGGGLGARSHPKQEPQHNQHAPREMGEDAQKQREACGRPWPGGHSRGEGCRNDGKREAESRRRCAQYGRDRHNLDDGRCVGEENIAQLLGRLPSKFGHGNARTKCRAAARAGHPVRADAPLHDEGERLLGAALEARGGASALVAVRAVDRKSWPLKLADGLVDGDHGRVAAKLEYQSQPGPNATAQVPRGTRLDPQGTRHRDAGRGVCLEVPTSNGLTACQQVRGPGAGKQPACTRLYPPATRRRIARIARFAIFALLCAAGLIGQRRR